MYIDLRRMAASAVTLALAGGSLVACGGDESPEPVASASAGDTAYPVTVEHKLGSTTLEKAPERIVALSDADLDALLLLGIQPVGVGASVHDGGISPWAKPELTSEPTVLEPGESGVDPEQVAQLDPDLVLAGGDYFIDSEYDALSPLVPTTAYETGPFEDPWQTTLRQVAKLVGKVEQGEQVIKDVEAKVAGVRTEYPALAGKTFSLSQAFEAGTIGVLRSPEDAGVKAFNEFGMGLAPGVKALKSEDFAVTLSLEKIATIDADVVMIYSAEPQFQSTLEANTLFKNLEAVRSGGYVALDLVEFTSLRNPSPLSTPYFIDNVLPRVAASVAS